MIDGVLVWDRCEKFVQQYVLVLEKLCRLIQQRAIDLDIPILEMCIRPAWAYKLDEAVVIDTEIQGDSDTRFLFLDDICDKISDLEETLPEEEIRFIQDYIFIGVDRRMPEMNTIKET